MPKYYKFVTPDNRAPYNQTHDFTAHIKHGRFRSVRGPLVMCQNGFHVADAAHLWNWFRIGDLYEVSVKGEMMAGDTKTVHRSLRFDRKVGSVTPGIAATIAAHSAAQAAAHSAAQAAEYAAAHSAECAAAHAAQAAHSAAQAAAHSAAQAAEYAAAHAAQAAHSAAQAAAHAAHSAAQAADFGEAWTAELIRLLEESSV